MGKSLEEPARAKLNLALAVRGRRTDGYHELWTIFDEILLADRLVHEPGPGEASLELSGDAIGVPAGPDNLVLRALAAFHEATGQATGGRWKLEKKIPAGAGLGGGSADAAAALRLCARRHGLATASLGPLAAALGADVPFLLCGERALGLGRGDLCIPIAAGPPLSYLCLFPGYPIATGEVFAALDGESPMSPESGGQPSWISTPEAIGSADQARDSGGGSEREAERARSMLKALDPSLPPERLGASFFNDLSDAANRTSPRLAALRERLAGIDMPEFHLSGSGGALFVATGSAVEAGRLAERLDSLLLGWKAEDFAGLGPGARTCVTRSRIGARNS